MERIVAVSRVLVSDAYVLRSGVKELKSHSGPGKNDNFEPEDKTAQNKVNRKKAL